LATRDHDRTEWSSTKVLQNKDIKRLGRHIVGCKESPFQSEGPTNAKFPCFSVWRGPISQNVFQNEEICHYI